MFIKNKNFIIFTNLTVQLLHLIAIPYQNTNLEIHSKSNKYFYFTINEGKIGYKLKQYENVKQKKDNR